MVMKQPVIQKDEKDYLVVYKPAGLPVETKSLTAPSLESFLKNKGFTYIAPITRIDQVVEGLVLFAKNKKAAGELSAQMTSHTLKKEYLAAVKGKAEEGKVKLTGYLTVDKRTNLSRVSAKKTPGSLYCELFYTLKEFTEEKSLLHIELVTGRHHQIRAQLFNAALPIEQDMKYNNDFKGKGFPALCSYALEFTEPFGNKRVRVCKTPENPVFSCFETIKGEITSI